MNVDAMNKLADFIEKLPEENFDMTIWGMKFVGGERKGNLTEDYPVCHDDLQECKTCCCIAGYQILQNPELCLVKGMVYSLEDMSSVLGDAPDVAQHQLGLDEYQATSLFWSSGWSRTGIPFPRTPKGAAARIRHMIQTGD